MDKKWRANVSTSLQKATADQIWPLFEDFFGLHKWFPGLATCHGVHGNNGDPGCIRYCSGFGIKSHSDSSNVSWSKEKLVAIDPAQMTLTYEIVDCNIGFRSYVSTVKVVGGGGSGGGGCTVEWWFSLDPVAGWELEDLVEKYRVGLRRMAEKMEAAVLANS